jgi:hypothetical protein
MLSKLELKAREIPIVGLKTVSQNLQSKIAILFFAHHGHMAPQ